MGMAASQARLLSLTARLSDLEFQAMQLTNAKIQLSRSTEAVASEYTNALNNKIFKIKNTNTPLTASSLTGFQTLPSIEAQRILVDTSDRILVSGTVARAFDTAGGSCERFLNQFGYTSLHNPPNIGGDSDPTGGNNTTEIIKGVSESTTNSSTETDVYDILSMPATSAANNNDNNSGSGVNPGNNWGTSSGNTWGTGDGNTPSTPPPPPTVDPPPPTVDPPPPTVDPPPPTVDSRYTYDADAVQYYTNLFNQIQSHGYVTTDDQNLSNPEWLYEQLFNGNLRMEKLTSTGHAQEDQWNTDGLLEEVYDTSDDARAELKYEVETTKIQNQDKKYDLELKQIETEHTAIQTEMESVKKVIDKNIEATFKIFA